MNWVFPRISFNVIEGPIRAYSLAKQTFFQAETAGKHGTERHKQRH